MVHVEAHHVQLPQIELAIAENGPNSGGIGRRRWRGAADHFRLSRHEAPRAGWKRHDIAGNESDAQRQMLHPQRRQRRHFAAARSCFKSAAHGAWKRRRNMRA
eukprot:scaffold7052_cov254-Pinguiococcus_pyrenoidosus.AAC.57